MRTLRISNFFICHLHVEKVVKDHKSQSYEANTLFQLCNFVMCEDGTIVTVDFESFVKSDDLDRIY